MFAAFFAAGWVMQYLITTDFGISYFMRPLSMFVFGQAYGMDGKGGDMLFVIVTRFILGFGCLWLPIAGVMAGLSALFNNRSTPATDTPASPQEQGGVQS